MPDLSLRKIVILGGGTAGWMAAAPLAQLFARAGGQGAEVVVVESPDIGVDEATLPPVRAYNRTQGIAGADFVQRTQGSFKLGIEFKDRGRVGRRFFHGFGDFGPSIDNRTPWQQWLRLSRAVPDMPGYGDWSMATAMARRNRFTPPEREQPLAANAFSFAYHFDVGRYAAYLREPALQDGRRISGDLFIDGSGFRALQIAGAMQSPFEVDGVGRVIQCFPDRCFKPQLGGRVQSADGPAVRVHARLHRAALQAHRAARLRGHAHPGLAGASDRAVPRGRPRGRAGLRQFCRGRLGARPESYDPFVDLIDEAARLRQAIHQTAAARPDHGDYVARHVKAAPA